MPGSRSNRERIATQNAAQTQQGASLVGTGNIVSGTGPAARPSVAGGIARGIAGTALSGAVLGAATAGPGNRLAGAQAGAQAATSLRPQQTPSQAGLDVAARNTSQVAGPPDPTTSAGRRNVEIRKRRNFLSGNLP